MLSLFIYLSNLSIFPYPYLKEEIDGIFKIYSGCHRLRGDEHGELLFNGNRDSAWDNEISSESR